MASQIITLLFFLSCQVERGYISAAAGLSEDDDPESNVTFGKGQVLAPPESSGNNVLVELHDEDLADRALQNVFLKLTPELGVGAVLPVTTGGADGSESERIRSRRRRSWLWNQFFVIEEYRGPEPVLIGRLHTDMDRGDGHTKYTLEGEGVGSVFVIDGNTGNIHVTKSLDREEKDQYRLIATATDRQTGRALEPSSEFIIRVQDINDNPPVFPKDRYVATVPEMANIGTSIIQVTARDADDPSYGNSARLVYAITQGQDFFSVDAQTGVLRTAVPDMDRETRDEYVVVLQAKDMGGHLGGLSGTTTVTVKLSDVNDNPPRFRRNSWSFSVSELAAPGVEVGRLGAADPDLGENAELEFTILDSEEAEIFNITGREKEGVIQLNKLLDYETRSSYTFSVEVSNPRVDARYLRKGVLKDQTTVRVMVLNADEPPQFSQARYYVDVSENCPVVCSVGRVHAVDPDTGQSSNIRYSIDPQSDPEALFRIASDTGFISAVMELDREQEQWHNITVMATQRDNPNLVSRVVVSIETLDQNDNAPELDRQYQTSVCDSSSPGQVVQVLRAIDRDAGGQHSPVHFSVPPESSSALNLTIRENRGVTASLVLQSPLEPLPSFSPSSATVYVPVVLRDGSSGLTNTGTVTVVICPCVGGGMQTEDRGRQRDRKWERHSVCLPVPSSSPSLFFSLVTLLTMLACVSTVLVLCALSLSLRHQKRGDAHLSLEEDDVRENIIFYDDEGGGEADTAAFDITALKNMNRIQHVHNNNNGNIWFTPQQQNPPRTRTFSWSRNPLQSRNQLQSLTAQHQRPGSAPHYGRLGYGVQTLPVYRDYRVGPLEAGLQWTQQLSQGPGRAGHVGESLVIQNQNTFEPLHPEHMQTLNSEPAGTREKVDQNQTKPAEADMSSSSTVTLTYFDPRESSSQSLRTTDPGWSQTPVGDSMDTVSSVLSGGFTRGDMYSVIGSLNPNTGAVGRSYPPTTAGGQLLTTSGLQRTSATPRSLSLPGSALGSSRPSRATVASNPLENLLNSRLDRVTFDLSQPPYDSLQTYEFEGGDSRAESLSSLESDQEQEAPAAAAAAAAAAEDEVMMAELNRKFQKLVEIVREREREKGRKGGGAEEAPLKKTQEPGGDEQKQLQRWDF